MNSARFRLYGDAAYINGEGSVIAIEVGGIQFVWPEVRRQTERMPRDPVPELEFWTPYVMSRWQDGGLESLHYISLLLLMMVQVHRIFF